MEHKVFAYKTLDDVRQETEKTGAYIPLSEDLSVIAAPLTVGALTLQNRFVINPMEGCDGTTGGAPDELTFRRYKRFAAGHAGLIWFEAVAITQEGRANPRQLMLTAANLDEYKRLLDDIREEAVSQCGFAPPVILQATHSGRYSRPGSVPGPMIAYNCPPYEKDKPIGAEHIVSNAYLDSLPEKYAETARLSREAGFDGVDVKACHRYLLNELFSAGTRPDSRYGGTLENRIRLYVDAIRAVCPELSPNMLLSTRLNVYDGPHDPYCFGASSGGAVDLTESLVLVKMLAGLGVSLINVTIGNPYVCPHVNRPFDAGPYTPPEHPLEGLGRMYSCVSAVKGACPGQAVVASGLSYLRQFSPYAAAGLLASGSADLVGFGREAFAYPDFAADILKKGSLDKNRCCISCSKCSALMRAGSTAGCVIRDEVYTQIYKRDVTDKM